MKVCSPPSAAELAVLFIPALLLLLPDLSEVNILGIGFKRDLDEAKDRLDQNQGTATQQVSDLTKASALMAERIEVIDGGVHNLALRSGHETDVLRATLETLASIEERVVSLEKRSG